MLLKLKQQAAKLRPITSAKRKPKPTTSTERKATSVATRGPQKAAEMTPVQAKAPEHI